jgi:hypothetical protein
MHIPQFLRALLRRPHVEVVEKRLPERSSQNRFCKSISVVSCLSMGGSPTRILITLGFNLAVAFVAYWLSKSMTTAWLTLLLFCAFAGLAEMSDRLWHIQSKVDSILKKLNEE